MNACLLCGAPARSATDAVWVGPPGDTLAGLSLCHACASSSIATVVPSLARIQAVVVAAIRVANGDGDIYAQLDDALRALPSAFVADVEAKS